MPCRISVSGAGSSHLHRAFEESDRGVQQCRARIPVNGDQSAMATTIDASLVGYTRPSPSAVSIDVAKKLLDIPSASDWGIYGDADTYVVDKIQAALDDLGAAGGGTLFLPWPQIPYDLDVVGLDIPDSVVLECLGRPSIISGRQQFVYRGTGAAIRMKSGEGAATGTFRSVCIIGAGVRLTAEGATGFRIRHGRDAFFDQIAVRMEADNQIGCHYQAEADGSSSKGVFDILTQRSISYTASSSFGGALHYKLSGQENQGQVNSCLFKGIRGGGAGKFCEIGPSEGNVWDCPEAEALTGDYFHFLDKAFNNKVFGGYVEAQSGYTGKVMRTTAGAARNEMYLGTVGINTDPNADLALTTSNVAHWAGRIYSGSAANISAALRVQNEAQNRVELRPDGLRFGDGVTLPSKVVGLRQLNVAQTDLSTANPSVTPDVSVACVQTVRLLSGAIGTILFNAPEGSISEGDTMRMHVVNNSGGVRTLSWSTAYIGSASLPTSLSNGARLTFQATRIGSQWMLIGAPLTI